jgi:hypothetical protein
VGNDRDGIQFRALISFDTSDLPDNSIVTAVKLKVRSAGIVGVDPVNRRRSLLVDLCTPPENPTGAHPALAATRTASCIRKAGRFSDPPNSGWYTASLEPPSLASLNLRGASLFRVRVDGTSAHDTGRAYLELYTALASEADSPILLVKYRLP